MSALDFNPYAMLAELEAHGTNHANPANALTSLATLAALALPSPESSDEDYAFQERAAIMEFEGGLSRENAERCAN